MASIADSVFDTALQVITTNGDTVNICSAEPANFAGIAAVDLGNATCTVGSPTNGDVSGRKVVMGAVASGSVTGNGTASFWAISDGTSTLYASGAITTPQTVTSGNTFTLTAIDIEITDAVNG